ncbi:glycoside hydrolase family 2 TIM barrel-domain containing protein [Nonomuraea sp. NPDC050022]|uniref:glycoside hydrolase family 2 TIM barrel-domain containing protein n=1 Tax=Nonomuraea sp. NPDC050022 TaxID=3364358 RepID=UPI0037979780
MAQVYMAFTSRVNGLRASRMCGRSRAKTDLQKGLDRPNWRRPASPAGDNQRPTASMVTQWLEAVRRDLSHPSIVGWCPLNETSQILTDRITQLDDVTRAMWLATKLADPTRPVLDVSGYAHRVAETDVVDSHDYEQDPAVFAANHAGLVSRRPFMNTSPDGPMSAAYRGQPYFVSEYGGIWWVAAVTRTRGSLG